MRFRVFAKSCVLAFCFAAPLATEAFALSQHASRYGQTYGQDEAECGNCHTGTTQSSTNLNAYGQRLQTLLVASPNYPTSRTNATTIRNAIETAEVDGGGSGSDGFASAISESRSQSISATGSNITVSFDPGRRLSGSNASISTHAAPFRSGFSYTKVGNAIRINVNLTPAQRGARRRAGQTPVRFQFVPRNSGGFFPTGTGNNEARELNEFFLNFRNEQPIAVDDSFAGMEADGTVTGNVITQTVAGEQGDRDIDGDAFEAQVVSPPGSGTLTLEPNGDFTYQIPDPLAPNPVTFTYRLVETDTGLTGNTATVTMTIQPTPNRPPVAVDDAFATNEDAAFSGDVTGGESRNRRQRSRWRSAGGFARQRTGDRDVHSDTGQRRLARSVRLYARSRRDRRRAVHLFDL